MRAPRGTWLTPALLALCTLGTAVWAQATNEYEVKATFLYKFASFVEWPRGGNSTVCIGIVGDDPFGALLDQAVKGKSIRGREFLVRRFRPGENPSGCDILFISPSEKKRLRFILDGLRGANVLTVGESPEFCQSGGVINFEVLNDRVEFEINLKAAARAQLKVSSKLLGVAKVAGDGVPR